MRSIINLNSNWHFSKDQVTWEPIDIPHTWNNLDGQDGGNDYYQNPCWYEKYFTLDMSGLVNTQIFLEFKGANSICNVYLNGKHLGKHRGGYSTFRFNITDSLNASAKNHLLVCIDNRTTEEVYPMDADFTFFGGLYRDVNIIMTNAVHFDLMDYGTSGIYITPILKDSTLAQIQLNTLAIIPDNLKSSITKTFEIYDAQGNLIATHRTEGSMRHTSIDLAYPHLWHGIKDPYLYQLKSTLYVDSKIVDQITIPFGIRSYFIDAEKGFFLNGEPIKLNGVARHQDRQDMGWAITKDEHLEDMSIIKEVGANAIRLAHYQHDQFFYTLCDQEGMLVWAEIPFISYMSKLDAAQENVRQQLTELIKQNYNHPSIFCWGMQNEIEIKWVGPKIIKNVKDLNTLAKQLDPTRLTAGANEYGVKDSSELNTITDISGYNHYFGWYRGTCEDLGSWSDNFHKSYPHVKMGITEYGAEGITAYHSNTPTVKDYTEEYQALFHEKSWQAIKDRNFLYGSFVWNMFDFASDLRREGGTAGRNNKGLVSYDRKLRKDSFYYYKAQWSKDLFVHITSKHFKERADDVISIKAYSNCETLTLFVNHRKHSVVQSTNGIFIFQDIHLLDGDNHIRVTATHAYISLEDSCLFTKVDTPNLRYTFIADDPSTHASNWF